MPTVAAVELESFARAVLTAIGLADDDAVVTAHHLVEANLHGVDTHGVMRLVQYAQSVSAHEVNPKPNVRVLTRQGCTALIDADGGYGFRPCVMGVDLAVELAREHAVGVVGIRDSHHFGAAGAFASRIAEAGLIGLVAANTGPVMAVPGGARPAAGNNPISVAVPRPDGPPLVLDMALSQTALGRIRLAAVEGRSIPIGWAMDREGKPTSDPQEALRSQMLAPMGGHKGYGLSLMIDVLAGVLTGSPVGSDADAHAHFSGGVGHFVLALRPDLFVGRGEFDQALERRLAEVLATPPAAGSDGVQLPGDPERRVMAERLASGIPLSDQVAGQLTELAAKLGTVPPPWAV